MKQLYLDALRDIAIEYIPQAKLIHVKTGQSRNNLSWELLSTAFLVQLAATASAKEQAAAALLNHLMALSVIWDEDHQKLTKSERRLTELAAISAAHTLYTLIEKQPPAWLPPESLESEQANPVEETPKIKPSTNEPSRTLPQPGTMIGTKETADLLKVKEQTLRSWVSKGSGPEGLSMVKAGRKNTYRTDDVLKLMLSGW